MGCRRRQLRLYEQFQKIHHCVDLYRPVALRLFISSPEEDATANGSAIGGGGTVAASGTISTPFSSNYTHLFNLVDHFLDNFFPVSAITVVSSYLFGPGLILVPSKDYTGF